MDGTNEIIIFIGVFLFSCVLAGIFFHKLYHRQRQIRIKTSIFIGTFTGFIFGILFLALLWSIWLML
jgi:biotin transporter BioY